MRHPYAIGIAIFICFVLFVEFYLGWLSVLAPWREISLPLLLIALALTLLSYALRALRIYWYFNASYPGRFRHYFRLSVQHNLINFLLPMRTGELSFPLLMSRNFNVPATHSGPALVWFRFLDMHVLGLVVLFTLGLQFLGPLLAIPGIAVWVFMPWLAYHFNKRIIAYVEQYQERRFYRFTLKVLSALPQDTKTLAISWLWTSAIWLAKLAASSWVLMQFIDAPIDAALLGAIAGDVTGVLPIHGVAGAGTYEVGVVAALAPFGLSPEHALQSAVNLHLFLLSTALLSGGISLLFPGPARNLKPRAAAFENPSAAPPPRNASNDS